MVLSLPVIGLMFTWFFKPDDGLVNTLLGYISNHKLSLGWLADPHLALAAVLTAAIWRHVGYVMVLYLAGLKGIDPAMREAAIVDGAGEWQLFRKVTLGLSGLRGEFATNWNLITAASLLAAVPTVIVYLLLQRQFLGGLFVGSNK